MSGRILAIDDERDILDTWADLLEPAGYELVGVSNAADARTALDAGGEWDVLLIDEKLQGPGGEDFATEILRYAAAAQPNARCIVITGYATAARARAALAAGAWDYLQKEPTFLPIFLPVRVGHAVEAARGLRLRRPRVALEALLRERMSELDVPGLSSQRKGQVLEELVAVLFQTIPGLTKVRSHVANEAEEIDVVVDNRSVDPILQREGSFILAECKNWTGKVGPDQLGAFRDKLRDRFGRARLGILFATGGFTGNVEKKIDRLSNEAPLVILIDRAALDAWVQASDREKWLTDRISAATFRLAP